MMKRNLASMLAVAGGLTLATAACSSPAEAPAEETSEVGEMNADSTSVAECGAAGCEAQPCAAAGCAAAADCAAAGCAAAGCAAKP